MDKGVAVMLSQFEQFERSIVRIKKENGISVGSGFLINDKMVLTCAHVASMALELADNIQPLNCIVNFDFPLVKPGLNLKARVMFSSSENESDIAGLEIIEKLPEGIQSIGLAEAEDLWGHHFRAFGYPAGIEGGVWASGVLRGRQDHRWVQIEDVKEPGHRIEPGYSGAPVWDDELDAAVGIVVAFEKNPQNKVAFIIPTKILLETFPNLEEIVQGPTTCLANLINVPKMPANFLPRDEFMNPIKESLLSKDTYRVGITSLQRIGIWGMGGIGKSVIAAAISRDEDIRKKFINGIIWLTIGQKPNLIFRQQQLAKSFGMVHYPIADVQSGRVYLNEFLKDKNYLIILDDVWEQKDAEAFDIDSEHSKILITTRKIDIIRSFDAVEHTLGLLNDNEALTLLATRSNHSLETLPKQAKEVAKECGNLPLALAMVGSMAKDKTDEIWENILHKLKTADLEKIHRYFKGYEHDTLFKAIDVSVEDLEPEFRKRYLELAVFPEDTPISKIVLQTFWEPEGIDKYFVEDAISLFNDRSLAQLDEKGHLKLHDLQLDYTRARIGDLIELYNKLITSYYLKCVDGWPSGPNDGFFFEHLPTILSNAGRKQELQSLLLNPKWLNAKLKVMGANALASDYDLFTDEDMKMVQGAIRLSAHIIEYNNAQLAGQLIGRLIGLGAPKIRAMLEDFQHLNSTIWLRPLSPSLMPPGHGLIMTLRSNAGFITALAVSTDGKLAVLGSFDGALRIWDLIRGKETKSLMYYDCWLSSAAIAANKKLVVSGYKDGTIKVWDLENGKELKTLLGHSFSINTIALSRDGKLAVSGDYSGIFKVWDLAIGKEIKTFQHNAHGCTFAVTADCDKIVQGSIEGTLKIWDLNSAIEPTYYEGEGCEGIRAVAVTADGKLAISGYRDGMVKVRDLQNGKELCELSGHNVSINAVAITEDGTFALSASCDDLLKIWDLENARELPSLTGHTRCINSIALTVDGKLALTCSIDGIIKIWNLEKINEYKTFPGSVGWDAKAVTNDGKLEVSASSGRTLKVYDNENKREIRELKGHDNWVYAVAINSDRETIVSWSEDGTIKVWDIKSGKELKTLNSLSIKELPEDKDRDQKLITEAAKTVDGELAISRGKKKERTPPRSINALAITADGKFAASGHINGVLKVWDLENGNEVEIASNSIIGYSCNSVTGIVSESKSKERSLRILDKDRGKVLSINMDYNSGIAAAAATSNAKLAVSGHIDGTIIVWDVERRQRLASFLADAAIIRCAIADCMIVVAGDSLGRIYFLKLENI
jgi:WD40 repeat protein